MRERTGACRLLVGRPEGKGLLGRTKRRLLTLKNGNAGANATSR